MESHGCHSPARDTKSTTAAESCQDMTGSPEMTTASPAAGSAAAPLPRSAPLDLLKSTGLTLGQAPGTKKIPLFAPHSLAAEKPTSLSF